MTRANKALAILMVAAFGLWGCAQGPAHGPAAAEKIKALEGKCSKLEDDYKSVAAARDQLRKKLADAEEQRAKLKQEVEKLLLVDDQFRLKGLITIKDIDKPPTGYRDTAEAWVNTGALGATVSTAKVNGVALAETLPAASAAVAVTARPLPWPMRPAEPVTRTVRASDIVFTPSLSICRGRFRPV